MKKRYYIYQLPVTSKNIFRSYNGDIVNLCDYVSTYTDEIDTDKDDLELCEELFEKFNINHPLNFAGHSMSISDIVKIMTDGISQFYFCDFIGFKKIQVEFET